MLPPLHVRTSALLLALLSVAMPGSSAPVPDEPDEKKEARLAAYPEREARCTNGSVLKLRLLDETLTLTTPYGKLVIPLSKITQIECATRLSPADAARARAAVTALGSEEPKKRDVGTAELVRLKLRAYPALLEAATSKDAEVQRRAKSILEQLREAHSEEELAIRPTDVIVTADSRIAGRIEGAALKVHTEQFGETSLKLANVRRILLPSAEREAADTGAVLADPGSLVPYANQVGTVLTFRVTGSARPGVFGMNPYTTDSLLAAAAVHAGVLKDGQTGTVKVKILPNRAGGFPAGVRNGVASQAYANAYTAFEVLKKP
jgi:hypothetical protein